MARKSMSSPLSLMILLADLSLGLGLGVDVPGGLALADQTGQYAQHPARCLRTAHRHPLDWVQTIPAHVTELPMLSV